MTSVLLPVADGRTTARAGWRLVRRRPVALAALVVLLVCGTLAGLVTPWVLGRLVDAVAAGDRDLGQLWWMGGAVLGAAIVTAVTAGGSVILGALVFETSLAELRESLVERALALPQARVEQAGTGDLVSRASDDVSEVSGGLPRIVPVVTAAVLDVVITLTGMAAINWRFGLALVLVLPVYVLALRWYLRIAPGLYAAERASFARRAHHVLGSLRGVDTVLAYRLEQEHSARIGRASWEVVRWAMRARTGAGIFAGRLVLAEYLALAAVLLIGYRLVGDGMATLGGVTTATLFLLRLFGPISALLFVLDDVQSAGASLARIVGVTELAGDRDASSRGESRSGEGGAGRVGEMGLGFGAGGPASDGVVSADAVGGGPVTSASASSGSGAGAALSAVTFAYAGREPVLHDVTLRIAPGERVALVGASGAGKTTVAALLAGILQGEQGRVEAPRRTMLLAQETHIFAGSVADNLRLARPEADDAELLAALDRVGARAMVEMLGGLEAPVGAIGDDLAPAQTQQLALARLVLADPQLAILDEATADADSADAGLLDTAAAAAIDGRSALVVAHRLSQAAACDRVVVMDGGRVVEEGAHDELVARDGVYARLWRAWAAGRE